jgi:hypothetical protein
MNFIVSILRTFFERKGFTDGATGSVLAMLFSENSPGRL